MGVTGYRIYRNGTLVNTVTGLSYTDTGLLAGTTYQYKVTAVDAAGNESTPGAVTSATTSSGSSGTVYTLTPTDDATIDPVTTDTLSASRLKVDANTPVNDLLMKYVVPASCSSVTSATLTLTVGSGSTDPSVRGGDFYAAANSNWSEGSVTWLTAPAKVGNPVSIPGAVAANTAYSKDVTSLVPTAGGTFSIRGSNTSGDGAGFVSKEGSATSDPAAGHLRLTPASGRPVVLLGGPARQTCSQRSTFSARISCGLTRPARFGARAAVLPSSVDEVQQLSSSMHGTAPHLTRDRIAGSVVEVVAPCCCAWQYEWRPKRTVRQCQERGFPARRSERPAAKAFWLRTCRISLSLVSHGHDHQ